MPYHVYESWVSPRHRLVIHRSECVFCNFGEGMRGSFAGPTAAWHGPFESLAEARALMGDLAASRYGDLRLTRSECRFCLNRTED